MLDQDSFGVSNKLLLALNGQAPAAVAQAMQDAVQQRLAFISAKALAPIESHIHSDIAEAQIADLVEVNWSAVEVSEARPYAEARQLAEVLLASSKSHRRFSQPSWGGPVPKSSLDGARESVIPESLYDKWNNERLRRVFGIRSGERLCGVGLLKRWGHAAASENSDGSRVVSTSHLASWSLRRHLHSLDAQTTQALRDAFGAYQTALRALGADRLSQTPRPDPVIGHTDGHVLFPGRMKDILDTDQLEEGKRALRRLMQAWRDIVPQLPSAPSPYFAVMIADGDRMGAALNTLSTIADHQQVTRDLEAFSGNARRIVEQHHGHLVFAGGDDVMALLPVQEAVTCADALRRLFLTMVGDKLEGRVAQKPTLSAGIAIAHHTDDLRHTLKVARDAEAYAKQVVNRNGWAITVNKRSGSPVTVGGKWEEKDDRLELLTDLLNLYLSDAGALPRGLPYDLQTIAKELNDDVVNMTDAIRAKLPTLRRLEVMRIGRQKNLSAAALAALGRQMDVDPAVDLGRIANRLLVARALSAIELERE
jgi:CRISPR-associated protein Cmr2